MTDSIASDSKLAPLEQGPGADRWGESSSRVRRIGLVGLLLVIALSMLLRAGIASIPLERDEGEYAYIAQRWLAGDVPYRDSFDQKPPGAFLAYAAVMALGADSIEAIHWLAHASLVGAVVFLYRIGCRLFSPVVGWSAALFAVLLVMDGSVLGNAANTEILAIFPLTAGLFFAIRAGSESGRMDSWWAGVCGGLGLLCKQVALPVVLFLMAVLVFRRWMVGSIGGPAGGTVAPAPPPTNACGKSAPWPLKLGLFLAGLALILVPVCLFFVRHGAWTIFLDCVLAHNLAYSRQVPLRLYPSVLWFNVKLLAPAFAPILLLALLAMYFAWVRRYSTIRVCLWWCLASFIAVSVGGYFRQHYFILMLPAVALLAACGLLGLTMALEPKRKEWQPAIAVSLAVATALWPLVASRAYYWAESPELLCRMLYGRNPFVESLPVAKLLEENSSPRDRIFIFGSEPQILFYANRASASRYIFVYPLFTGSSDAEARQQEVVDELTATPPEFIVIVDPAVVPPSFFMSSRAPTLIFEYMSQLLESNYVPFAGSSLKMDGKVAMVEPVTNDEGSLVFPAEDNRLSVLRIWRRRGQEAVPPSEQ